MKNSERILNTALIDFLDMISQRIDDCLYQILTDCTLDGKQDRCKDFTNCYDCLSKYLNEEERTHGCLKKKING